MLYDKNGKVIQTYMFDQHQNPVFTWAYDYDKEGNVKEESLYNAVAVLISHSKFLYEFDKNGNWIRRTTISADKNEPIQMVERKIIYF